jgi:hypothetical protein
MGNGALERLAYDMYYRPRVLTGVVPETVPEPPTYYWYEPPPPVRPPLPEVTEHSWTRNGIDRFVLERLEQARRSGIEVTADVYPYTYWQSTMTVLFPARDFEDLLEDMLAGIARGAGDILERTGTEAGDVIRSRKGDFVLSIDPRVCRGADLRVVIEAKDRPVSARAMRDELAAAKGNRRAAAALVCITSEHAPPGIAPFDIRGGDVYCAVDPAAPDGNSLEAAVRLARLLALATIRDESPEVDVAAVGGALEAIRGQLDVIRGLKAQLTSIGSASQHVSAGLERLREGVLARVGEAEALLRPPSSG